jgi:hypothetical protein
MGGSGDILAVLLKMGGAGEILAELWRVSVELGDETLLTVFGVSSRSRHTLKDLQFVDEPCCLEVPAFWKKSIPQFVTNVKQIKRGAHKHLLLQTTHSHTTQNLRLSSCAKCSLKNTVPYCNCITFLVVG